MGKVVYREQVHTFHIDINHHVNNAIYVEWLEIGRERLLEAASCPVELMQERGYLPVLVETWIQYREPLHFPDTVRIEVWVSELTHVTAWMAFRFYSERSGHADFGRKPDIVVGESTKRTEQHLRSPPGRRARRHVENDPCHGLLNTTLVPFVVFSWIE